MHVGLGETDITPQSGLPLAGMPWQRKGDGIRWPLHGRVAVFDDGEVRAAVVSLDLLFMLASTVAELREALADGHGIEPGSIMIACSHTHSAPYATSFMDEDPVPEYLDLLQGNLVGAMDEACRRLAPAKMLSGSVAAPGLTFNRRPIYANGEVGTQGPLWTPDLSGIEGPVDDNAEFIWFEDSDGAVMGGLVNFACHPTTVGASESSYSADYPGALTERLGDSYGGTFCFLQGAAGELWAADMSSAETAKSSYQPKRAGEIADALLDRSRSVFGGAREIGDPRISVRSTWLKIPQRSATWREVELARGYLERGEGRDDEQGFTREMYGHDYTFHSHSPLVQSWFCREAIGMWEWQRRATARLPLVEDVEVQVMAIGDVAIVGYPCELFTEFGLETKQASPFPTTIVAELANGWFGYVPTIEAFERGGYEPRLGYQSRLERHAGKLMTSAAQELLEELGTQMLADRRT